MERDPVNFLLMKEDLCRSCGQRVIYTDIGESDMWLNDPEEIDEPEVLIQLSGDNFLPSQLTHAIGFPIEIIAETGKIASSGRYQGKKSPYGLGNILIKENIPISVLLGKVVDKILSHKESIRNSGCDSIEIVLNSKYFMSDQFFISVEGLDKIRELNASIRILNLR